MNDESDRKSQLLNALDFEISKHEREDRRLSISFWSLIVSFFLVAWSSIDHLLKNEPELRFSFIGLVFFAAYCILNNFVAFVRGSESKRQPFPYMGSNSRFLSWGGYISQKISPIPCLIYQIIIALGLAAFAALIALCKFPIYGWTIAFLNIALVILMLVAVAPALWIQIPILPTKNLYEGSFILNKAFTLVIIIATTVPFIIGAVLEFERIKPEEWKLGILLAALLKLLDSLATRSQNSPVLRPLENVRSRLAFGRINSAEASDLIDDLILGMSGERYVSIKVSRLEELYQEIFESLNKCILHMRKLIELNAQLEKEDDPDKFLSVRSEEIKKESSAVFALLKDIIKRHQSAEKLKVTIKARIKIAEKFLDADQVRLDALKTLAIEAEDSTFSEFKTADELMASFRVANKQLTKTTEPDKTKTRHRIMDLLKTILDAEKAD